MPQPLHTDANTRTTAEINSGRIKLVAKLLLDNKYGLLDDLNYSRTVPANSMGESAAATSSVTTTGPGTLEDTINPVMSTPIDTATSNASLSLFLNNNNNNYNNSNVVLSAQEQLANITPIPKSTRLKAERVRIYLDYFYNVLDRSISLDSKYTPTTNTAHTLHADTQSVSSQVTHAPTFASSTAEKHRHHKTNNNQSTPHHHEGVEGVYNPLQTIRNRKLRKKYHDELKPLRELTFTKVPIIAVQQFTRKPHRKLKWFVELGEKYSDLTWRTGHWNELRRPDGKLWIEDPNYHNNKHTSINNGEFISESIIDYDNWKRKHRKKIKKDKKRHRLSRTIKRRKSIALLNTQFNDSSSSQSSSSFSSSSSSSSSESSINIENNVEQPVKNPLGKLISKTKSSTRRYSKSPRRFDHDHEVSYNNNNNSSKTHLAVPGGTTNDTHNNHDNILKNLKQKDKTFYYGTENDKLNNLNKSSSNKSSYSSNISIESSTESNTKNINNKSVSDSSSISSSDSSSTESSRLQLNIKHDKKNNNNKNNKLVSPRKDIGDTLGNFNEIPVDSQLLQYWQDTRYILSTIAIMKHRSRTHDIVKRKAIKKRNIETIIPIDTDSNIIQTQEIINKYDTELDNVIEKGNIWTSKLLNDYSIRVETLISSSDRILSDINTTLTLKLKLFQENVERYDNLRSVHSQRGTKTIYRLLEYFIVLILWTIWLFVFILREIRFGLIVIWKLIKWTVW